MNLRGTGVELRMYERRIEEGIHVNQSRPPGGGGGGALHMKGVEMLVGNFELNP